MATGIRDPAASTYTFASQPRAVATQRRKYREGGDSSTVSMQPCNIMYDPRVVRGSTYRQNTTTGTVLDDPVEVQRQREARRRKQARARAEARVADAVVDPVPGRMHIEVQTDVYLEELTDRVEEADIAVQTDPFLDRAPDPVYIPAKTGVDAETQILDGELFDFDLEAQPILEVLVGKTMEQSLMEVMEEEELDRLRDHQLKFEELRNAELIETQRLEEQARRRREEKERRLKQQREVADQEREATKKIAARSFAQSYLSGLVPSVFRNLEDGGYFFDAQEREVETEFIPWLLDGVESELAKFTRARALVDAILAQVLRAQHPKPTSAPKAAPEPATDANAAGEASAAEVSASDEAADPSEGGESSLPPEQDDAKADVSEEVKNDGGAGEATDGDGAAQSNDDGIGDGGPDQASKDGDGETAEPEAAPDGDAA